MTHLEQRWDGSFRTQVTSLFFTELCVSATFCISFHAGSSLHEFGDELVFHLVEVGIFQEMNETLRFHSTGLVEF
jgi:hypothetical protein